MNTEKFNSFPSPDSPDPGSTFLEDLNKKRLDLIPPQFRGLNAKDLESQWVVEPNYDRTAYIKNLSDKALAVSALKALEGNGAPQQTESIPSTPSAPPTPEAATPTPESSGSEFMDELTRKHLELIPPQFRGLDSVALQTQWVVEPMFDPTMYIKTLSNKAMAVSALRRKEGK
jgi:hypothetical protein